MSDPTRDEILEFINSLPYKAEADECDIEEAIYWFANDYHGGQWSNLYSVLSTSEFSPGAISNGPSEDSFAEMLYDELVLHFTV